MDATGLPDELPADLPSIEEPIPAISEPEPAPEEPTAPTGAEQAPAHPPHTSAGQDAGIASARMRTRQEKAVAACLAGLDQHNAEIEDLKKHQRLAERNILILAGGLALAYYLINRSTSGAPTQTVDTATGTIGDTVLAKPS